MNAKTSACSELLDCLAQPPDENNLRKIVLIMTRFHWGKQENHGNLAEKIGCLVYDFDDPSKSTMPVELVANWDNESFNNPGIYVGLVASPLRNVGVGNLAEVSENGATETYSWICDTRLAISHVFPNEDMCYLAAESTQVFFAANHKAIAARQGLMAMRILGKSEPRRLKKAPTGASSVDVILEMSFTWSAEQTLESHLLKEVVSEIQSHTSQST